MAAEDQYQALTRRERQIMDVVYRLDSASVSEVRQGMPDPPGYSAVRAMLVRLEEKGHLTHVRSGSRYVYRPTVAREQARASALERMLGTFFGGSPSNAVAAILDQSAQDLSEDQLDRLARMIAEAREGRGR